MLLPLQIFAAVAISWIPREKDASGRGCLQHLLQAGKKTEALLCFDVELAVAPGLGKNQGMRLLVGKTRGQSVLKAAGMRRWGANFKSRTHL
jgi:hypothetical protein